MNTAAAHITTYGESALVKRCIDLDWDAEDDAVLDAVKQSCPGDYSRFKAALVESYVRRLETLSLTLKDLPPRGSIQRRCLLEAHDILAAARS